MRIGVDIGGSHIGVGLIDGKVLVDSCDRLFKREDRHNIEDVITSSCLEFINCLIERNNLSLNDIELVGVSAPGDISDGKIIRSDNLGIYDFDITSKLKEALGIPVQVRNDAKAAAMAEFEFGSMRGTLDSVFLCLGTGIGGAVFVDGKLMKNGRGFEVRSCCY